MKTKAKSKVKRKRSKSAITGKYVKRAIATESPETHIAESAGPNFRKLVEEAVATLTEIESSGNLGYAAGMLARDWLYRAERALKK